MFAAFVSTVLLAASAANALAIPARALSAPAPTATAPASYGWWLEDYSVYHTRYLELGCEYQHGKPFFDKCCHPLWAIESLSSRPAECTPTSSVAGPEPTTSAQVVTTTSVVVATTTSTSTPPAEPTTTSTPPPPPTTTSTPPPPPPTTTSTPPPPPPTTKSTPPPPPPPTHTPPPPPPTTTHTPPPPAPTTTKPAGSAPVTGGFGTYFYQNGNAGACGNYNPDNAVIAAIDSAHYSQGVCGKKLRVTNTKNGKWVDVTIADECPTCNNAESVDLSVGAFTQIATKDEGMVPISYVWL